MQSMTEDDELRAPQRKMFICRVEPPAAGTLPPSALRRVLLRVMCGRGGISPSELRWIVPPGSVLNTLTGVQSHQNGLLL